MKLTHKLCGAALLAVIGVAVAAPSATQALNKTRDGKADIEFTQNTEPDTSMTDPTGTRTHDTGTDIVPEHVAEFGVIAVTPLNFDKKAAKIGEQKYEALPHVANRGNEDEYEVENYVAIKDVRSTTNHTYKLSAALTKQFTATVEETEVTLKAATLTYKNINVAATLNPDLQPAEDKKVFGADATNISELKEDGSSVPVYTNNDPNGGKGRYEVTFGDDAKGTAGDSVSLFIPASVDVRNAAYNATVTWTLSDTL
ncbi:hypothetical protein DOK67_0001431 [Enterococcus sp. DIV0212c]|uniref:WxL domain-containing protein n=1 Tax=Enterococcus sp. DIV0212c TaxID=2230867 RepID=UPI001A9A9564|nr:WxL domain-containing protein [Enterococcus sp. DIV0212c]MBO1354361.1 WxL domain-containing protein [Enterococcus sp. DIV0212c]